MWEPKPSRNYPWKPSLRVRVCGGFRFLYPYPYPYLPLNHTLRVL